jgi:hypothetical protein
MNELITKQYFILLSFLLNRNFRIKFFNLKLFAKFYIVL